MAAISLEYAAPEADLRDYVSVFYDFRADIPLFQDEERADLAQFRFLLSPGSGEYHFADGTSQATAAIQILGPTTGVTRVRVQGPVDVFGAGLLPAGWAALMGTDASAMVNRMIDATAIFGRSLAVYADRLRAAATLCDRAVIGNEMVHALVADAAETPGGFTRMVDRWLASAASPDIDCLVAQSGLSRRQIERLCKRFYGVPPKLLARKYRALRAAVAMARGEAELGDVLDRGFYDQSHFIREVKQFTGITPKKFAEDLPTLARLTLKRGAFEELSPLVTDT